MPSDKVNLAAMARGILEAGTRISVPITIEFADTVLECDCAWCGKRMPPKPGKGATGKTSSICCSCYERVVGEPPPGVPAFVSVELRERRDVRSRSGDDGK